MAAALLRAAGVRPLVVSEMLGLASGYLNMFFLHGSAGNRGDYRSGETGDQGTGAGAGGTPSCANPQSSSARMSLMRSFHDQSPSTAPTMRWP